MGEIMTNRFVVGAHYGLKDWLAQRVTAIYMALFTFGFVACLFGSDSWSELFECQSIRFFGFLFILAVIYHAWVGIRDIWMDYVKPTWLRLTLHTITLFLLIGYTGWAIRILWRL
jgi:succinate dehydrogenase / fumarate reductase membrane anchor subunit